MGTSVYPRGGDTIELFLGDDVKFSSEASEQEASSTAPKGPIPAPILDDAIDRRLKRRAGTEPIETNIKKQRSTKQDDDRPRVGCPFHRRDPAAHHKVVSCRGKGFAEIPKLRDHLKDVHRISDEILQRLNFKKGEFTSLRTIEAKWKRVFRILFPEVTEEDIPCPYGTPVEGAVDLKELRLTFKKRIFSIYGDAIARYIPTLTSAFDAIFDDAIADLKLAVAAPNTQRTGYLPTPDTTPVVPLDEYPPLPEYISGLPLATPSGYDGLYHEGSFCPESVTPFSLPHIPSHDQHSAVQQPMRMATSNHHNLGPTQFTHASGLPVDPSLFGSHLKNQYHDTQLLEPDTVQKNNFGTVNIFYNLAPQYYGIDSSARPLPTVTTQGQDGSAAPGTPSDSGTRVEALDDLAAFHPLGIDDWVSLSSSRTLGVNPHIVDNPGSLPSPADSVFGAVDSLSDVNASVRDLTPVSARWKNLH